MAVGGRRSARIAVGSQQSAVSKEGWEMIRFTIIITHHLKVSENRKPKTENRSRGKIKGGKTAISLSVFLLFCFLIVTPLSGDMVVGSQQSEKGLGDDKVSESRKPKTTPPIAKITYRIDTRPVSETAVLDTLKKRTHITVGAPFSRYAIQQSVVSLYASAQFSQVNVYALDTPEGVILTFDLKRVVHIKKIEITGVPDELKRALRKAMHSKVGHVYLPAIAESEVPRIKAACTDYGYFSPLVIHKPITAEGQLTYQITLGHPTLIKTIQIQGHDAVSTTDILDACRLSRVGKPYRKYAVETDIAEIRALYRKKHYPTATIVPTFTHKTGVLLLQVNQGKQYLLDFLSKKDGRPIAFSSGFRNFLAKFGIGSGSSEEMEFREKIINAPFLYKQTIQAHFEVKGYYGTEVDPPEIVDTPLKYHAKFTIDPGTRYTVKRVSFSGNKAFSDAVLLREMQTRPPNRVSRLIRKRFLSKQTLQTDKQSLEILYKKAGYPKAAIEIDLTLSPSPTGELRAVKNDRGTGEATIHVSIVEHHKEVIQRCHFTGNQVIDAATLLAALPMQPPQPNESLLEKSYANAVLKVYYEQGYVDAEVRTKYMDKTDTPVFQVPGNFSEQLDARILPPELRDEFEKHGLILAGTFIASKIDAQWIIQDAENNARYTLKQQTTSLAVFEHGVLHLQITEGLPIAFGTFYFGGDPGVKRHVLTREIAHLSGTLYTPSKLSRVLQNLYKTGLFEPGIRTTVIERTDSRNELPNAKPPSKGSRDQEIAPTVKDILIELQKQKPGAYGASIGYNASEGARGTLALSHRNIFKRNIRFLLRGRGGIRAGTLGYLYDATITEPWLLGRTQGSLQWAERNLEEDDNVRARQASFSLSRELPRDNRLELQYSFRHLRQPDATITPTDKTTTVSSIRLLWTHNSRFPSINPISGKLNEVTLEYASSLLGGQTNFIKTVTDTRYYRKLHASGLVLATALRFGITTGLGSSRRAELISFERFWAGGSTTVRGYAERGLGPLDSTGRHRGNVQLIFNTELRFPLYSLFDGVLFFDAGNIFETVNDIDIAELPASVGPGLYLNLGPLRVGLDYAVPLRDIPNISENTLYFRVGSTF